MAGALVVVVDGTLALLLRGERDVDVEVEVAAERRCPGKRPAHPPPVRLEFGQRRPRHRPECHVVVGQVHDDAVKAVGDGRAGRAPRRVVGPEHEVVDQQLRAPAEQVRQRGPASIGVEAIGLVDPDPRQLLALQRHLVTAPRQLLLSLQQLKPGRKPLLACSGRVGGHRFSPHPRACRARWRRSVMPARISGAPRSARRTVGRKIPSGG